LRVEIDPNVGVELACGPQQELGAFSIFQAIQSLSCCLFCAARFRFTLIPFPSLSLSPPSESFHFTHASRETRKEAGKEKRQEAPLRDTVAASASARPDQESNGARKGAGVFHSESQWADTFVIQEIPMRLRKTTSILRWFFRVRLPSGLMWARPKPDFWLRGWI
jgi:hypothetical protein